MSSEICKFLLISFSSLFLFVRNVYSAPLIEIKSCPPSAIGGEEFQISFSASLLSVNTLYYSKGIGVDDDYDVQTWSDKSSSWLNNNSSWSSMPEFISDSEGSASVSLKIRFKPDIGSGTKNIKVRIRSNSNYDSESISISVSAATPSPSPTPTYSPAQTATPTSVSTATAIPTSTKSPTPKPTKTPTPKPTTEESLEEDVLGVQDQEIEPSPEEESLEESKKPKISILAIVFIFLGILFVGFSGFAFFKQKGLNKSKDEQDQEVI